MRYTILVLIVLSLTFVRCLETDLNYVLPFEQKPVAIGFLDSLNGARVYIGKNADILNKDSSIVKGATASLWSADTLIEELRFLEKNVFVTSANFKLNPKTTYYFKATTPLSKDSLISEKITVPPTVAIEKAYFQYVDAQKTRINLYLDITDPEGFNAYSFYIQRFKQDTLFDADIKNNPFFIPINGELLTDRSFQGTRYTFKIENVGIEEYQGRRAILMDRLRITLFNMDKPTYNFFQSVRNYEPGVGDPFFEPITLTNQLKNGLGVFSTYSSYSVELKL